MALIALKGRVAAKVSMAVFVRAVCRCIFDAFEKL
jgi:hypothetical protein